MKKITRRQFLAASAVAGASAALASCSDSTDTTTTTTTTTTTDTDTTADAAAEAEPVSIDGDLNVRVFAAAGGVADLVTRITFQCVQDTFGNTAVISNLTGANGAVAAADMNTYDASINEMSLVSMSLFTMTPLMNPELGIQMSDYRVVGSLIRDEFVLMVGADSGITSWEDLVAYGQDNTIIYASNTPGGGTHVIQIALFGDAGLDASALTSDGSNYDILAVMSGDAICTSATITMAKTYIDSGDMIPIAMFSANSYTGFDGFDVPALPDLGYDITVPSYNFLITRGDVSEAEAAAMYDMILAVRETDSFLEQAEASSYTPDNTDGEVLAAEIADYAVICEDIYNKYYV